MMSSSSPDSAGPSTVPGAWAPRAPQSAPVPTEGPELRKPQARALSVKAHAWLARLPPRYQPLATARRHPHIVNQLSELWGQEGAVRAHLHELMLSSRPGRRAGFAFEVLTELADLQALVEDPSLGKA